LNRFGDLAVEREEISAAAEETGMRLLFTMDKKDYDDCTRLFSRDSARSIVIRNGTIAMIHSQKYHYYKFPGGGIEQGEDPIGAMMRETREEAGLIVIPETVREYGYVHRVQKSDYDAAECFVQDNFYFLCDAQEEIAAQNLDDYEAEEAYRLAFVEPAAAIKANRSVKESPYNPMMFEREARVLEMLIAEGLIR
jgi:8-oxo-dGTP pyrophosphatase MutT (NUDIX family)